MTRNKTNKTETNEAKPHFPTCMKWFYHSLSCLLRQGIKKGDKAKTEKDKMTSPQFYVTDIAYIAERISSDSYSSVKDRYVLVCQHLFFHGSFSRWSFKSTKIFCLNQRMKVGEREKILCLCISSFQVMFLKCSSEFNAKNFLLKMKWRLETHCNVVISISYWLIH